MYNQTITRYTPNMQAPIPHHQPTPPHWKLFFDTTRAEAAVWAHCKNLQSANTPEQLTKESYTKSLDMFKEFAGDNLPTDELINFYIIHLKNRGLVASSIMVRLAPVRIYLRALANQATIGYTGFERDTITQYREQIRTASTVKNPPTERTSYYGALWNEQFIRLTVQQVNVVLRNIDRTTLQGKRDYALLMTAFYTALRITEMTRITLNSIGTEGNTRVISIRRKRSNHAPAPLADRAYNAIIEWVEAYNEAVRTHNDNYPSSSCAEITGDTPIWQPLEGENTPMQIGRKIGTGIYNPLRGLLQKGIRMLIGNRTADALGEKFRLAAHDTRRTAAYIAHKAGMSLIAISRLLGHKDVATTLRYIGVEPDYEASNMETHGVVFA